MPLIVGISPIRDPDPLLNGFTIDRGRKSPITVLYGDVPANVRAQSIANQEAWINTFATQQLGAGMFAAVHIFSLGPPMAWTFIVSSSPVTGAWWTT